MLLLELYNDANAGRSAVPIEGFEAEALGVLRVNLLQVLAQSHDQKSGGRASLGKTGTACGVDATWARVPIPTSQEELPHTTATSWRYRKEQWFGGPISPSRYFQHEGARDASSTGGFVVEARLEVAWGGRGVVR